MKTQYELEAPWQLMESVPMGTAVNVMHSDGTYGFATYHSRWDYASIAWCPIVPPKVKRWRAERGAEYWRVDQLSLQADLSYETDHITDANRHAIGNYYRTREEAEAAAVRVKKAYQGGCDE